MKPLKEGPFLELLNIFSEAPPFYMYILKDSHNYVFMEKRYRCLLFYLESTARRSSISIISKGTEKNIHRVQNISFHVSRLRTSTWSTFATFAENLNLRETFCDTRLNKSEIWVCSNLLFRLAWGGTGGVASHDLMLITHRNLNI